MPTEIQLPVGRIVWGHPIKAQKKTDQQTRKPIIKPDGTTIDQWAIGLAIPDAEFVQKVWPAMEAEARSGFPQGIPPQFSFKYKSGQGTDRQGKPYATREGYAGHYVLTIATEAFAPSVYKWENGSYRQLAANEIKCGDYIVATVKFQVNVPQNKTHTPGLYVNPVGFLLVGYGTEIVGAAADPTQIFGNAPPQFQLPPGASITPINAAPNIAPPYGSPMPGQPGPAPGQYAPQPGPAPGQYAPQPGPAPGYPPQGPQPGGYAPQPGPISSGPGPAPGYQPPAMPGQAPMQPGPGNPAYGPAPGQYAPQPGYAPAHDFVQNAGQQQPGGYPQPGPAPGPSYPPR